MFYSHDLLTKRQYGVATIWLVATLGSKSNLKKVSRKAIADVNIPKACETITNPDIPLALRLQASLLYGVSRVHAHQCGYMLTELHSFKDRMRGIEQIMKDLEIDPDIGKTKSSQLNLPEDPGFMPELDMNFDLTVFGLTSETSCAPSILSSQTLASSRTSIQDDQEEEPGLVLPSLDIPGGEFGGFETNLGGITSSVGRTDSKAELDDILGESPIIENPEFEIAEDGSIVPLPSRGQKPPQSAVPSAAGEGRDVCELASSARVRAEHETDRADSQPNLGLDDEPMVFGDDDVPLPPAQPFSPQRRLATNEEAQPQQPPEHTAEGSTTTMTAEAPQRRVRRFKPSQIDVRAELSNRQLGDWNNDYVANMAGMIMRKGQVRSLAFAKKNAAFWVMDQGIGGVKVNFGEDRLPHPLAVLSGQTLINALRGREDSPAGSKRSRSASAEGEEEEEPRRVRARTEGEGEGEVGRGAANPTDDDGIIFQGDDDMPIESQVGRHAQSSLPDRSSAMPWNVSGSRQGSAPALGSTDFGVTSSAGGVGGMQLGPRTLSRRGSRLTSASPLVGKGIPKLPSLDIQDPTDLGSEANFNLDDMGPQLGSDDFELYGPSALVDTQEAATSQWVKNALEDEAYNFLEFLETQISKRGEGILGGEDGSFKNITLDTLLPPVENTKVVVAQALLHILSLTTKGLIEVEQKEARGDIWLKFVLIEAPLQDEAEGEGDGDVEEEDMEE